MNQRYVNSTVGCILFANLAAAGQSPVQWQISSGGNGHWYRIVRNPLGAEHWRFEEAQAVAEAQGARLAIFASTAESAALYSLLDCPGTVGRSAAWVGLRQDRAAPDYAEPGGGWRWVDGSPLTFDPWLDAEPSNACGGQPSAPQDWGAWVSWSADGGLDDLGDPTATCPDAIPYAVFEWSADCNGDGVVDLGQILEGSLPDENSNWIPDACDHAIEPQGFIRFTHPTDTVRIFGNTDFPGVDFTYEMRIRLDPASPFARVISEQRDTFEDKSVWMSGNAFLGYMTRNQGCGNLNEIAVDGIAGQWHHVAWTRADSTAKFFVDGIEVASWSDQYVCTGNSEDSLMALGMIRYAYGCAEQAAFRGDIDWLRISRTSRYSGTFVPPSECAASSDPDTLLRLTFNEGPGASAIIDSGPNGFVCQLGAIACGAPATAPVLIAAVTESGCSCTGDLDGDGDVDGAELGQVLLKWGPAAGSASDLNHDGQVDGDDLSVILSLWGPCPGL
jgi:hypothetical protein